MQDRLQAEDRNLFLHRVILDEASRHASLIERALAELPRLRTERPRLAKVWERWAELLVLPFDEMAAGVLSMDADGGLLRANSPFLMALDATERNALWQRVGLQQFTAFFLMACDDLAVDLDEQASIAGLEPEVVAGWRLVPPRSISGATLERLKDMVGLQRALARLYPDQDLRRTWLRSAVDSFPAPPIRLLLTDQAGMLREVLTAAVQSRLGPDDVPSH
ncbi:MAG: hypothetical protein HQL40_16675 [Alphaproteobacteria bacterium]|nr:hypothetical protein [Alphaproteobacteria bacterium]